MTLRYDYDFDVEAVNNTAAALFRAAREHGPRVLDLGSGPAVVSSKLARDLDFDVTCIDADVPAIEVAKERGISRAYVHDLTRVDWVEDVRGQQFDLIVMADVLEHLARPQELLAAIREADLLAPGGRLLVSMPNASHEIVISSLLVDDFHYTDTGVLDDTHVRWFTLKSMQRLLQGEGYSIIASESITRTLEQTSHAHVRLDLDQALRRTILEKVPHASVYQYVLLIAPLAEAPAALVARDDEIVREATVIADDYLREFVATRGKLEARIAEQDARIAELSALLQETRSHSLRELKAAATDQGKLERQLTAANKKDQKNRALIRKQEQQLRILAPYLRGRRLAGRVKRRLKRAVA